jgi:hypothetical protein
MKPQDIAFSIDSFDKDGDLFEKGVYLHFGGTSIKVCDEPKDIAKVGDRLNLIISEIKKAI